MDSIRRVNRSKEQARISYNRLAFGYDWLSGSSERKFRGFGLARLAAQPGESVLEIGFGTGCSLVALARLVGPEGRVFGIDISEAMMRRSEKRLARAGLSGRVELCRGDAAALPYHDRFFHAVFLSFTLELFDTPDIPRVLHECRRVLQDDGRLCVVCMAKADNPGIMSRLYDWSHEKFPTVVDCRPILAEDAIKDAGFTITEATVLPMMGLPVAIVLAQK
jgi:ubiquinone/menaquinone biosynthesis C-methylase UbiE